ncbi:MAG: methyltransferase [Candidatus Kapaibacterium sp.]
MAKVDKSKFSESHILTVASAFRQSKILLTAIELGVFSLLGSRELTAKDVSFELKTDEDTTERLLNSLTSLGFTTKHRSHFKNTSDSIRFLDKSSPDYLGSLLHMNLNWESWGKLTEVVRTGKSIYKNLYVERSDEFVEAYVDSVHRSYNHEAEGVSKAITLSNVKKMMDLGCGSGMYSIEFMKRNPEMEVVLLDYPKVIPITQKYLEQANLNSNNYRFQSGIIKDDEFESNFDLIYASFLFEEFTIWENMDIMRKCFASLNKGGRLIIHENFINNDRTSPLNSFMYSLNLKLHTENGNTFSENDYWIMLKEAGFQKVDNLVTEYGTILIRGTKTY